MAKHVYITSKGRQLEWETVNPDDPIPSAIQDEIDLDDINSFEGMPGVGDEKEVHETTYDHEALVAGSHAHTNKTELDLVSDGDHDVRTDNPHTVTKAQVGLTDVPDLDTTDAVNNEHMHSNKTLLDTYTQTEVDLADVISKEHAHTNKTELDLVSDGDHDVIVSGNPHVVTKAEVGLTNVPDLDTTSAVTNDHTHTNKALIDTYTQTEVDLADAVTKKHEANKDTLLDEGGANEIAASAIRGKAFTPTVSGDWTTSPTTVQEALDELAARVKTLEP